MTEKGGSAVRPEILGRPQPGGYEDSFNRLCSEAGLPENLLSWEQPLHYDEARLKKVIERTFAPIFKSATKLVEAFDCDLVLVSGKPSEVQVLKDLLRNHIPLMPQRIIFSKNTYVGHWYPLSTDGFIHDAKTVTVAGAALYQAINNGMFPGWSLDTKVSPYFFRRQYWGVMPVGPALDFGRLLLDPSEDEKTVELMIKDRIGRAAMPPPARPEPMYRLMWRDRTMFRDQTGAQPIVSATLRRTKVPGEGPYPATEILELAAVSGHHKGKPLQLSDLELQMCTLDTDEYWIDAAMFQVEWEEN
jgi:hypothetical protein